MDQKTKEALERIEHLYLVEEPKIKKKEDKISLLKVIRDLASENNLQQWVHLAVGDIHWYEKDYQPALKEFEKALAIIPEFAYAWNDKGNALDDLGRKDEALAAYERAIELDPKFFQPWNGQGNVLYGLKKYDEALAAFEKAIELDPKYATPRNGKGNVLYDLKKDDEAIAAYEKAIELDPDYGYPYYSRGIIFQEKGKWHEAKADFEKYLSLEDDESWKRMAGLRLKQINEKIAQQAKTQRKPSEKKPTEKTDKPTPEKKTPVEVGIDFAEQYQRSGLADMVEDRRTKLDEVMEKALNPDPQLKSERINNSLHVLRDWNSYTPILPAKFRPDDDFGPIERRGGGYFLVWRGFGVVIDPGLHFITQLYNKNLSIADVNAVVITHCHLDHTRDIEALVDLNYRYKKFKDKKPNEEKAEPVHFYLGSSAKHKYQEYLKSSGCCANPKILTGSKRYSITDYLDIVGVEVFHDDIVSRDEAIGCIFEFKDEAGTVVHRLGFTSDTRQHESLAGKFEGCNVLLAHLGTTETIGEIETGLPNHLGVMGCCDLMMKVKPKLFIVGEFGEELIQARLNILEFIAKNKPEETKKVLAADSKLSIKFGDDLEVFCNHPGCESNTISIDKVKPLLGEDSLFRYYCGKHFA
ncbi:MAG TPA: tetratricopeptide repeat protein [bacterium]|nr:tetratricopeptide repeat protein [bacterium]